MYRILVLCMGYYPTSVLVGIYARPDIYVRPGAFYFFLGVTPQGVDIHYLLLPGGNPTPFFLT